MAYGATWLKRKPGRTAVEDAKLAWAGALYHYQAIEDVLKESLPDDGAVRRFHWHLRGFFWELLSVRDSLAAGKKDDPKLEKIVEDLNDEQWFKEVSLYRNFAHQSFHVVEAWRENKPDGKLHFVTFQKTGPLDGGPPDGKLRLERYLVAMQTVVKGL